MSTAPHQESASDCSNCWGRSTQYFVVICESKILCEATVRLILPTIVQIRSTLPQLRTSFVSSKTIYILGQPDSNKSGAYLIPVPDVA